MNTSPTQTAAGAITTDDADRAEVQHMADHNVLLATLTPTHTLLVSNELMRGLRRNESLLDYDRACTELMAALTVSHAVPNRDVAVKFLNVGDELHITVYAAALNACAQREDAAQLTTIKPKKAWMKASELWFTRDGLGTITCPVEYQVDYVQDILIYRDQVLYQQAVKLK